MKKNIFLIGGTIAVFAIFSVGLAKNFSSQEKLNETIEAPTVHINAYGLPLIDLEEERKPSTIADAVNNFTTQEKEAISRLNQEEKKSNLSFANAIYQVPFGGKVYVFRLSILDNDVRNARLEKLHVLNSNGDNMWSFVTADDVYIKEIVRQAKAYSAQEKISTEELLIAFAKNIPYNRDLYTGHDEYPKYAVETLADHSGDCEDIAILGANLIGEYKGYSEVAFVYYPNHIGLGYKVSDRLVGYRRSIGQPAGYVKTEDRTYLYQEMTHPYWQLGQIPEAYQNTSVTVYAYNPTIA